MCSPQAERSVLGWNVQWGLHQGHLVFQCNPDEGQSLYRLGSQPTASCSNIRMGFVNLLTLLPDP
jgi:hypothetical protein